MKKTKSVRTICAMSSGVIDARRDHEGTKTRRNTKNAFYKCCLRASSCFRAFVVAASVRSHRLPRAPGCGEGAAAFCDVRFVFVAEVLQGRQHRRDRGVAERAQRLAGDVAGDAR